MKKNIIFMGDVWGIADVLSSFSGLNNYTLYYVSDSDKILGINNEEKDFLHNIDDNYLIVVSNYDGCFEKTKKELIDIYNISDNNIIEMRYWLADVLESDKKFLIKPSKIRLDFCTLCQLKCRDCYMRKDNFGCVGAGFLKFTDFKKLIDENPFIEEIEMSNSGEVFLNPEIDDILKYAHEKNVTLFLTNGTNFNDVKDSTLELLVTTGVVSITFSIDGATNGTYKKYRVNGDLNKVLKNIKKLNKYKKKYKSDKLSLNWQYIVMNGNVKEIEKAREIADRLNMNIFYKREWSYSFIPEDVKYVEKITGLSYSDSGDNSIYNSFCVQMVLSPQINWDGRILGCCVVFRDDWGSNAFKDGFLKALNSEKYRKGVITLLRCNNSNNKFDEITPCIDCYTFTRNDVHIYF